MPEKFDPKMEDLKCYEIVFNTKVKTLLGTWDDKKMKLKVYLKDISEVESYVEAYKNTFNTDDEVVEGVDSIKEV
jgi:hypothetical protein